MSTLVPPQPRSRARRRPGRVEGWSDLAPVEVGWLDRHPNGPLMATVAVVSSVAVGAAVALKPELAVVLIAAVAVGLVVLRRPAVGGYLLVGLVPITSGLRSGFPIPGFRLSELLIGTLSIAILVPAAYRHSLRWRTFDWLLLAYATYSVAIGAYDLHHDGVAFSGALIGTLFGPMQFLLLYRSVAVSLTLRRHRDRALAFLILGSIPVSFIALLQQLKINGINNFVANITGSNVFSGYGYFFARATGPFSLWTPLAGYLLVIILVGMSLLLHGVEGVLSRRVIFAILALDVVGLLLSAELSAMIALVPAGVILGAWSGKVRFLLRWGFLVVVGVGVSFGSYLNQRLNSEFYQTAGSGRSAWIPQTIQFRWEIWTQQYFPAIREQLFTGYGPTFPSSIIWQYTESQYVTFLMWGGIPLLVIFTGMMWALFSRARVLARPTGDDPSRWAVARAVALLVACTYFVDLVYPYLTSGGMPQALFALVGIMVAAQHTGPDRATPVQGAPLHQVLVEAP